MPGRLVDADVGFNPGQQELAPAAGLQLSAVRLATMGAKAGFLNRLAAAQQLSNFRHRRTQSLRVLFQPQYRHPESIGAANQDLQIAKEFIPFVHEAGELALYIDQSQRRVLYLEHAISSTKKNVDRVRRRLPC